MLTVAAALITAAHPRINSPTSGASPSSTCQLIPLPCTSEARPVSPSGRRSTAITSQPAALSALTTCTPSPPAAPTTSARPIVLLLLLAIVERSLLVKGAIVGSLWRNHLRATRSAHPSSSPHVPRLSKGLEVSTIGC